MIVASQEKSECLFGEFNTSRKTNSIGEKIIKLFFLNTDFKEACFKEEFINVVSAIE